MRQKAEILTGVCLNCGKEVTYKKNPSYIGKKRVFCKKEGAGKSECFLTYFKKHGNGFQIMDNFV